MPRWGMRVQVLKLHGIQNLSARAPALFSYPPAVLSSLKTDMFSAKINVRFGSLADNRARASDVRFTPLKADMLRVGVNVCKVPEADIRRTASRQ